MGETCSKQQSSVDKDQTESEKTKINKRESIQSIAYENGSFLLPKHLSFDKQSTYIKIQKAAYNFCQENNIDLDFMACITRIIAYRQEKVFLSTFKKIPIKERINFIEDINRIPQDQIDLFYHNFLDNTRQKYKSPNFMNFINKQKSIKYQIPNLTKQHQLQEEQKQKFINIGKQMLKNKQIALVIMCAGSNSRFDTEEKFLTPLNLNFCPALTLLDLMFVRLKKNSQKNEIPIIISFNEINFKQIQSFLRERNYYGYDKAIFKFIQVDCLPVLDIDGQYCINEKYKIVKRPFGTVRTVIQILKTKNCLALKDQGISYLHFIGAQNLLESPCDPLILGMIKANNKKIVAKCVSSLSQWEKLPRYGSVKGKIFLKLWNQLTTSSEQNIKKNYKLPIATNSLVISFMYLQELIKDFHSDIYLSQNYHILRKKQKIIDSNSNKLISKQCITFEGDIRDLLACCSDVQLLLEQRKKSYIPIISKNSQYSLHTAIQYYQKKLFQQYNSCQQIHKFLTKFEQIKTDINEPITTYL